MRRAHFGNIGTVWHIGRFLFTYFVNFFINIALTRILAPNDYGVISVIISLIALMAIFTDLGLNNYLVRLNREVTSFDLGQLLKFQFKIYVIIHSVATVILSSLYFWGVGRATAVPAWLAFFVSIPILIRNSEFVRLERSLNFRIIAKIELIETVVYSGTVIIMALNSYGPWSVLIAIAVKSLTGCLLSVGLAKNFTHVESSALEPKIELKEALLFGAKYHIPNLLSQIRALGNPLVIGIILGIKAVGVCDRAAYIAAIPISIVGAIQNRLLFMLFARMQADHGELNTLFRRSFVVGAFFEKLMYAGLFYIVCPRVVLIFGREWEGLGEVIKIMILGNVFFGTLTSVSVPLCNSLGKGGVNVRVSLLSTLTFALVLWPLTVMWGVKGFAYASMFSWLSALLYLSRHAIISPENHPFKLCLLTLVPYFISGSAMALIHPLVVSVALGEIYGVICEVLLLFAVYAGTFLLLFKNDVVQFIHHARRVIL